MTQYQISPILVVGVGTFGRRVFTGLDLARRSGASDRVPPFFWTAGHGWVDLSTLPEEPTSQFDLDSEEWWLQHQEEGLKLIRRGLECLSTNPGQAPHVIVLFHLQEKSGRTVWRDILDLVRKALPVFTEAGITLVVGIDSRGLRDADAWESAELLETLAGLDLELQQSAVLPSGKGRLDWCYLLDVLDTHANPILPFNPLCEQPLQLEDLQAQHASGLILALQAGLHNNGEYRRTALAELAGAYRNQGFRGRVSAFWAGVLHFPVPGTSRQDAARLARRLIEDIFLQPGRDEEQAAAGAEAIRWAEDHGLTPMGLLHRLRREPNSRPADFPAFEPDLSALDGGQLMAGFNAWRQRVEEWWDGPTGVPARVNAETNLLTADACQTMESRLLGWVQRSASGLALAQTFLETAGGLLADLRSARAWTLPNNPPENHWFRRLLAAVFVRKRVYPLEACQLKLEKAAAEFHTRSLEVQEIRSQGWWHMLLRAPRFVWVSYRLLRSEWRLHPALHQAIEAVQGAIETRVEGAIQEAWVQTVGAISACVHGWEERLQQQRAVMAAALEHLRVEESQERPQLLWAVERDLLPLGQMARVEPAGGATRALAEKFLVTPTLFKTADQLANAILVFCLDQLKTTASSIGLKDRITAVLNAPLVQGWLSELIERHTANTRPLLQLSPAERGGLPVGMNGLLVQSFAGLPILPEGQILADPWAVHLHSGEERIWLIQCLHGLELSRLRLWDMIRAAPARLCLTGDRHLPER